MELDSPSDMSELDEGQAPARALRTGPARILCVDDEARIVRALKALFRDQDVTVTTDPEAAIEMAAEGDFDVIICDQRMPNKTGVDVLRAYVERAPRTMRILLTGYADLKAVLGSVNEGEVFRYINKPWSNADLRAVVAAATEISRAVPNTDTEVTDAEREEARQGAGVLVIEDNAEAQNRLREILAPHYQVRFAATPEKALQILEQHETGVVISETMVHQGDLTGLLKALKREHPYILTVVITERANAQTAIDLINEGQVYRLLLKPIRLGSCRLSVESALERYWTLKRNPALVRRFEVQAETGAGSSLASISESLMARIRQLPRRLFGVARLS